MTRDGATRDGVDLRAELERVAVAAAAGDRAALDRTLELIDRLGLVRTAVRRVVVNAQMVEDVCQDVVVAVAERVGSWDGRSRFSTWLYTVARNRAIDAVRRQRPTDEIPARLAADQRRVSSMIAERRDVQAMLEDLPDRYRRPVIMRDVEQLAYDEIAALLDLKPATVRTRVSRGRVMIGRRLEESPQ
ncbi:RNA polymerase sigma factor [Euzebya pacifica]|uniref:RNA polymerase sigma factor n=1 Tax=Euzebya pacifica TaxID=1608957 RepID=UPI0030F68C86